MDYAKLQTKLTTHNRHFPSGFRSAVIFYQKL